jgi:hypothetical protein
MADNLYEEISYARISRGTNVNASTLPAKRVVGFATNATYGDAVDALSVVGVAKAKGVTRAAIAPGETGDIVDEPGACVVVETTAAAVAVGQPLTAEASTGKVVVAAPAAGANAEIVGWAQTAVGASGGDIVMRFERFTMQGA